MLALPLALYEKTEKGREDRRHRSQRLTARTTRMRITAKQGWFWRDRATAGEFIVQTEHTLDELPAVTRAR